MGEYEARLQNRPVDVSGKFGRQANHFYVGERTEGFDAAKPKGCSASGRTASCARRA